jgi:hypothetical protein
VLVEGSVLNFIKLVQLSLKDDEIFTCLRVKIQNFILHHLKGICNFQEVLLGEEEVEISLHYFLLELIKRDHNSVLLKVLLQASV